MRHAIVSRKNAAEAFPGEDKPCDQANDADYNIATDGDGQITDKIVSAVKYC